jgi:hypothetical protein
LSCCVVSCLCPQRPLSPMLRSGRGCPRACSIFFPRTDRRPCDSGARRPWGDREATAASLGREYAGIGREFVGGPWVAIRSRSRPPRHRSVPATAKGLAPTPEPGAASASIPALQMRHSSTRTPPPRQRPSGNDRVIGIRPADSVSASGPAPAYRFSRAPVSSRLASFRSAYWSTPAACSRQPTNRLGERPCIRHLDIHIRIDCR